MVQFRLQLRSCLFLLPSLWLKLMIYSYWLSKRIQLIIVDWIWKERLLFQMFMMRLVRHSCCLAWNFFSLIIVVGAGRQNWTLWVTDFVSFYYLVKIRFLEILENIENFHRPKIEGEKWNFILMIMFLSQINSKTGDGWLSILLLLWQVFLLLRLIEIRIRNFVNWRLSPFLPFDCYRSDWD